MWLLDKLKGLKERILCSGQLEIGSPTWNVRRHFYAQITLLVPHIMPADYILA